MNFLDFSKRMVGLKYENRAVMYIMQHTEKSGKLAIPYHSGKEVKKGLLTSILKQANIKTTKR